MFLLYEVLEPGTLFYYFFFLGLLTLGRKNTVKLRRKKYTFEQLKLPIMISTLTLFWIGRKRSLYNAVLYVWYLP